MAKMQENDMMSVILKQLEKMDSNFNNKFEVQNNNFNDKFDEMTTQNVKFESNMNKRLNEIDERFSTFKDQIIESINSSCEKKFDEMNKNLEVKKKPVLLNANQHS